MKSMKYSAWFNPGWQPQAQLGDGNAPKAAQPSPNPLDLRLPPADMEPQINVTRNLTYLNQAKYSLFVQRYAPWKILRISAGMPVIFWILPILTNCFQAFRCKSLVFQLFV
jgi:hypothetical protein